MALTDAEIEIVEQIAQMQVRHEKVFKEQAAVLRTDQTKYDQAVARLRQTSFIAKPGQDWQPTNDKVDLYLAKCDEICHSVPHNFDDRVKMMYAAHGALMCLATVKIGQLREPVEFAIMDRYNELVSSNILTPSSAGEGKEEGPGLKPLHEAHISKPLVEPRHITAEELHIFEIPDNLLGKQFILSPSSDESCLYKVIGYAKKLNKMVTYDVLFDDCGEISVETEEMMGMLKDRMYFPE